MWCIKLLKFKAMILLFIHIQIRIRTKSWEVYCPLHFLKIFLIQNLYLTINCHVHILDKRYHFFVEDSLWTCENPQVAGDRLWFFRTDQIIIKIARKTADVWDVYDFQDYIKILTDNNSNICYILYIDYLFLFFSFFSN